MMTLSLLEKSLDQIQSRRDKMILVYGVNTGLLLETLALNKNLPLINISKELSEHLLQVSPTERARLFPALFSDLLGEYQQSSLLITRPEIFFEPTLAVDPVRLLLNNAKNKTLIVQWPGKVSASTLSYATLSHPEYRSWRLSELGETILINADENH